MFVGREKEIKFLEHYYEDAGNRILVVYGMSGVGKNTLLKEFSNQKQFSYYLSRACSDEEQRIQWAKEITLLSWEDAYAPSYKDLFSATLKSLSSEEESKKKILIIDEFHNLIKADSDFMPQLVNFVNETAEPCMVILCSSQSGWVENSMIPKIGALATYLSGLLKVRELKFSEICQLYPMYSIEEQILLFSLLGGNPGLWNMLSLKQSAKENLTQVLLNPNSRLFAKMSGTVDELLREPAVYNTILANMAGADCKLNELYERTGFSRAKISVYLKNLMELELVEKVFSYETDGYANTRKGVYRISNPLMRFYFRFVFPSLSRLRFISGRKFYEEYIEDEINEFIEEAYCRICREIMTGQLNILGEWIGKSGRIDIVAQGSEQELVVAKCSYGKSMQTEDYRKFKEQLQQAKIEPALIYLFSEQGFSRALEEEVEENVKLIRLISG